MSLLTLLIGSGVYVSLKKLMPPGPVKYVFMGIFFLEKILRETPEERKKRIDEYKAKVLAAQDPRFDALRKLPRTKDEAMEMKDAAIILAKESFEKAKEKAKVFAAQAKEFIKNLPETIKKLKGKVCPPPSPSSPFRSP